MIDPNRSFKVSGGAAFWMSHMEDGWIRIRYVKGDLMIAAFGCGRRAAFGNLRLQIRLKTDPKFRTTFYRMKQIEEESDLGSLSDNQILTGLED